MAWLLAMETKSQGGIKAKSMKTCLNCKNELGNGIAFCPVCGQKAHETKLTVWSLLSDFFGSLFNLDNGLYRSLLGLPIPAFLSKQFMSGKRKSYLNPVRLFLITLIIHLSVLTNLVPFDWINESNTILHEEIGQKKVAERLDKIQESSPELLTTCDTDTLSTILFEDLNTQQDSQRFTGFQNEYNIKMSDLYDMPVETFISTYGIESYWEKMIARQAMRTVRDPAGAIRFGVSNLIWSILSTILITGLFMKLLYIRRKRYFVEHLIVLFNIHSFCFLIASVGFWLNTKLEFTETSTSFNPEPGIIPSIIIVLFFYLSLKFYYKQGWIKTFIKYSLISWVYIIIMITMISLVTLISLFFFS